MTNRTHRHGTPIGSHAARSDYCGVRLGVELRARAIQAAAQLGIPLSEWFRMAVASALDFGLNGVNNAHDPQGVGYMHGRAIGLALAQQQFQQLINGLSETIPMSLEEATARGLVPPIY